MRNIDKNGPIKVNGVSVEVKDNFERALKKFTRLSQESGLLRECRERKHYEKPSETRKRKQKESRKRWLKKKRQSQPKKG